MTVIGMIITGTILLFSGASVFAAVMQIATNDKKETLLQDWTYKCNQNFKPYVNFILSILNIIIILGPIHLVYLLSKLSFIYRGHTNCIKKYSDD